MLSFVHDLQVCVCPNFEDDVIYLRALCLVSYRKYDTLLTPGSEMAYVGIVLTYHKQSNIVSEPYATSPTVVSSNLILSAPGIIFGSGIAGFTLCIF